MDKAIEIILVVVVLFVTALIVVSMITGEADGFMNFSSQESSSAECRLWDSQANREENPVDDSELPDEWQDCPQYS